MTVAAAASILWPMLAQIGWVFMLYAWLTVVRRVSAAYSSLSKT